MRLGKKAKPCNGIQLAMLHRFTAWHFIFWILIAKLQLNSQKPKFDFFLAKKERDRDRDRDRERQRKTEREEEVKSLRRNYKVRYFSSKIRPRDRHSGEIWRFQRERAGMFSVFFKPALLKRSTGQFLSSDGEWLKRFNGRGAGCTTRVLSLAFCVTSEAMLFKGESFL